MTSSILVITSSILVMTSSVLVMTSSVIAMTSIGNCNDTSLVIVNLKEDVGG